MVWYVANVVWRRCLHSGLRFLSLHCGHSNLQPPKLSTPQLNKCNISPTQMQYFLLYKQIQFRKVDLFKNLRICKFCWLLALGIICTENNYRWQMSAWQMTYPLTGLLLIHTFGLIVIYLDFMIYRN